MAREKPSSLSELRKYLDTSYGPSEARGNIHRYSIGNPVEAVVDCRGRDVVISLPQIRWKSSHVPVLRTKKIFTLQLTGLPHAAACKLIAHAVKVVRGMRRDQFQRCRFCRKATPPEWIHQPGICQSCATKHLHIVY